MIKIKPNRIITSSAVAVKKSDMKFYDPSITKVPVVGDLVFAEITKIGHHKRLESKSARKHTLNVGTRAIFTFGTRYSPDQFEGAVPTEYKEVVELFSGGGVIGDVVCQNALIAVATKVKILGYVCNDDGKVTNTTNYQLIKAKNTSRTKKGAKIILCVGTTMNSGKTHAAAACCYALASVGKGVRASKVTGTASLKDILLMNDCGAEHVSDFTYFGYPSTYMLDKNQLFDMFNQIDMKYGNNPKNYLVLEFADGIMQRETAMLLQMPEVRSRIHKLVFCAPDSIAASGGIQILKDKFNLVPDAISGVCSSSPLMMAEIKSFTNIPILQSMQKNYKEILDIIG